MRNKTYEKRVEIAVRDMCCKEASSNPSSQTIMNQVRKTMAERDAAGLPKLPREQLAASIFVEHYEKRPLYQPEMMKRIYPEGEFAKLVFKE